MKKVSFLYGKGALDYTFDDGELVGEVNLIAQTTIELDVVAQYTKYITDFFSNKYFIATAITLLLIIVFWQFLINY